MKADRYAEKWAEQNPWFGAQKFTKLTAFAYGVHQNLIERGVCPVKNHKIYYAYVDAEIAVYNAETTIDRLDKQIKKLRKSK